MKISSSSTLIGKLKLFEGIYTSIHPTQITLSINSHKLNFHQIKILQSLMSQKNKSNILPRLAKKENQNDQYQIICKKCGKACSSFLAYDSLNFQSKKKGNIQLFQKIIEGYQVMCQLFLESKGKSNVIFRFENNLFQVSCPCKENDIILLDLGCYNKKMENNFSKFLKMLNNVCASDNKPHLKDILNELIPPDSYGFYQGLLRSQSVLKSFTKNYGLIKIKENFIPSSSKEVKITASVNKSSERRKKFSIQNFFKKSHQNFSKSNQTSKRLKSHGKNQSHSKKKRLNLFKSNQQNFNITKESIKLQDLKKEKKLISQLRSSKKLHTEKYMIQRFPSEKQKIDWIQIEKLSQSIEAQPTYHSEKVQHSEVKNQIKIDTQSKENKQQYSKLQDVFQKIERKLSEEIDPIGENVKKVKSLISKYKEKSLLPMYLLYKKFFYLRVTFLSTLMNPQQSIFPFLSKEEWKEILSHKQYQKKISIIDEQNNKIMRVLHQLKEKVMRKITKKTLKLQKKEILQIGIENDESYQMFIHSLVKLNIQKYFHLCQQINDYQEEKILLNYGKVIILAVQDDIEDEGQNCKVRVGLNSNPEKQRQALERMMRIFK